MHTTHWLLPIMLFRHTLLYLPAQILGPLFQFLSIVAWTHFTDQNTIGIITLITATHELVQTAFMAWWSQYVLRFIASHQRLDDQSRIRRTETFIIFASILAQMLVGQLLLSILIAPQASWMLTLATLSYIATRSANLYFSERARARGQIGLYTIEQTFGPVVGLGLGLLLLTCIGNAPEWPLIGYAIAQILAIICMFLMSDFGRDFGRPDQAILRQAVRYGLSLVGSNFTTWITLNGSRLVVELMLGLAAAGLYGVGFGLGQRAGAVSAMLATTAAFPLAIKRLEIQDETGALKQLSDNRALLFAILLPTCAELAALRYDVALTLIGSDFRDATSAIVPFSVTLS